jgi:hypothetical protein
MPCESTGQLVGNLLIYLIHGEGALWNTPRFVASTGLCAICTWISRSRTGHTGSHCGTQAALISGAHTEHPISWCAASGLAREKGGYMEAQITVYLTSLLLWSAGYITPWQWIFEEITQIHHSVSWYSWSFGAAERYFT